MRIFDKIFFIFLLAIILTLCATYLGPARLLVVKSGSMSPKIPVNALILTIPQKSIFNFGKSSSYKQGDIISFKRVGVKELITHRVAKVETKNGAIVYQTKGDANESADLQLVSSQNVLGQAVFSVPLVGNIASFLGTFLGIFLLVVIPASFVILHEVLVIGEEMKNAKETKFRKETVVILLVSVGILTLVTPIYALFSSTSALAENSLTTAGITNADHVLINEVYYQVAAGKGQDSLKDRGLNTLCQSAMQNNSDEVTNTVNVETGTGGNSVTSNIATGSAVTAGDANTDVTIDNNVNQNNNTCFNNDEWAELYNPTASNVNLKNWSLTDTSGREVKINGNKVIKSHMFALIARSNSTWRFWQVPQNVLEIALGTQIGNGLDNAGDSLSLKDANGVVVDALSWGNDTRLFNPGLPLVALGSSNERKSLGLDTDEANDFLERLIPTPGE